MGLSHTTLEPIILYIPPQMEVVTLHSKSFTNPCSWFSYCPDLITLRQTFFIHYHPERCLHNPAVLLILFARACCITGFASLCTRYCLAAKGMSRVLFTFTYMFFELYTLYSVQLRHRLLHRWTVSTPASTAAEMTWFEWWTLVCSNCDGLQQMCDSVMYRDHVRVCTSAWAHISWANFQITRLILTDNLGLGCTEMRADLSNLAKASQFNLHAALIYSHMILKYD